MWLVLVILLGIFGYIVTVLSIFCLISTGRKADERENRTLELISPLRR